MTPNPILLVSFKEEETRTQTDTEEGPYKDTERRQPD